MIYVFLANGFEETEALTTVDILRRCELDVMTVGVGSMEVTGSHGILVMADALDTMIIPDNNFDAIVLPGGMPGTLNLEKSVAVQKFIDYAAQHDKTIAAICAAPSILGHKGLLDGKKAVCFPGFESQLGDAIYTDKTAVRDCKIVTAKGAGCTIDFALEIGAEFAGKAKADKVRMSLQCAE